MEVSLSSSSITTGLLLMRLQKLPLGINSLQNKNNSQLLSLPLPSLLLPSDVPVAVNNADNDSNPSSLGGDQSNTTTRCSQTKKRRC